MFLIFSYIRDFFMFFVEEIAKAISHFKDLLAVIGKIGTIFETLFDSYQSLLWFFIPLSIILALIIFFRLYNLLPAIAGGGGSGD